MSDYYGQATLEDWLAEEVFSVEKVPENVVFLFEKWRIGIEADIKIWMDSDDGDGNNLSWRGWERGFASIPDEDESLFKEIVTKGEKLINEDSQ